MGTRSRIIFQNEAGENLLHIYRQYDGYPEGRGLELAKFLSSEEAKKSNGIEDLAALWLCTEKTPHTWGNVYVTVPTDDFFASGEEFVYIVQERPKVNYGEFVITLIYEKINGGLLKRNFSPEEFKQKFKEERGAC